jgi:putative ubiquitin-RnfH superfamily antitoxin RatB of RatAB toxin-antitoxin module
MLEAEIVVEVVYAGETHISRKLRLPAGSTALQAVEASGLAELVPAGAFDPQRLGIFARRVSPDQVLRSGDRVEIYRPLLLDPMTARRQRARGS